MLSFEKKPLSETGLRQFITKALDKGWIREGWHSEVENAYRNISEEDIRYGLSRKEWVLETAEPAKKGFKYLISTVDIEQEELHLLVLPDTETGTLKVLTKF